MYVVLGATGHVGASVAQSLLAAGENVMVVTRNALKAEQWRRKGAQATVLDVHDTAALASVFRQARRAFLLNPPAAPSGDTDTVERQSAQAILSALKDVALEKLVLLSTYGAQSGPHSGDLGVLYDFEQSAQQLGFPLCCVRAAYYMSNWCSAFTEVQQQGQLTSLLPADLPVPMVAPHDVGAFAAQLLMAPLAEVGTYAIEGPKYYTAAEVAQVMAQIAGRPIELCVLRQDEWLEFYRRHGFSQQAAQSYAHMTSLFVTGAYEVPQNPQKGRTALAAYLQASLRG